MTHGAGTRAGGRPGWPRAAGGPAARRAVFGGLLGAAIVVAIGFRLIGLDLRPMHHDEANQAVKFGALLETGEYRYDPDDHHGPALYYFTLPAAWARGQTTLASLDERTLRAVPALFGIGLILLMAVAARDLGPAAGAAAVWMAALSPALTYFSRFYIQESLFAFLGLAFLIALGRYATRPGTARAACAGACAGLAWATKETAVIVLPAAILAVIVARAAQGRGAPLESGAPAWAGRTSTALHAVSGLAAAVVIALLFYSSFLKHAGGLLDSIRAIGIFAGRGLDAGAHRQAWDYYLRLLWWSSSGGIVWTEAVVLLLALVGLAAAIRRSAATFWPIAVATYAAGTLLAYSAIPYKTPWNLLPFYAGVVLLAGLGVDALVNCAPIWGQTRIPIRNSRLIPIPANRNSSLTPIRGWRVVLAVVLAGAAWHLGVQNWRANFVYAADARNPYAYAQAGADVVRLATRVAEIAAVHPDRADMVVRVIAGPYEQWPLPWYLRRMRRVGYWSRAADAGALDGAPLIVASQENAGAVGAALGDRYVSEFYGLRPGVLLTVYIERTLWERFLEARAR